MAHLITGYAGYEHIKSEDDGAFNAAFFGNGQYVCETGNQFAGSIIDNNTVRILDGDGMMYGRHFRIRPNTYEDLMIQTGTAGTNRIDLICMTYEKSESDGTEQVYLQVIKGTETSGTPIVPSYTDGNIINGAMVNQMPLYKVTIEGVVLSSITKLFNTISTFQSMAAHYASLFQDACNTYLNSLNILDTQEEIEANTSENQLAGALAVKNHTHAASKITAGTLAGKVCANETAMATLENAQIRDVVCVTTDPGAGASVTYPDGTVIHVYE